MFLDVDIDIDTDTETDVDIDTHTHTFSLSLSLSLSHAPLNPRTYMDSGQDTNHDGVVSREEPGSEHYSED